MAYKILAKKNILFKGISLYHGSMVKVLKYWNNWELKRMSNQPTDKYIYTANQNIIIPLKKVLSLARH